MTKLHIKIINGRGYYYTTARENGKIVTKYWGPCQRLTKPHKKAKK